uniref:Uncharacterized protein n=1 Tax=Siphoviridae sp. ctmqu18 TaxID=2825655 RepID=A0A8S5V6L2_9CAUD|nr:MAG TPA: hypothetical protein [Siphoviridae sp. ctmqu18]
MVYHLRERGSLIFDYPKQGEVYRSVFGAYVMILKVDGYHGAVIYLDSDNRTQVMKLDDFMGSATVTHNGTTRSLPMFSKCKEMSL